MGRTSPKSFRIIRVNHAAGTFTRYIPARIKGDEEVGLSSNRTLLVQSPPVIAGETHVGALQESAVEEFSIFDSFDATAADPFSCVDNSSQQNFDFSGFDNDCFDF